MVETTTYKTDVVDGIGTEEYFYQETLVDGSTQSVRISTVVDADGGETVELSNETVPTSKLANRMANASEKVAEKTRSWWARFKAFLSNLVHRNHEKTLETTP
jgi:hypothetical protein